jgi:hypothetical protein
MAKMVVPVVWVAIAVWSHELVLLRLGSVHDGELTLLGSPLLYWSSE